VGVFGALICLFLIILIVRGVLFAFLSYGKSVELHNKMFKTVIYARMSFFDSTPIGRVLNAFARHQFAIDSQLADALFQLLQFMPVCVGATILIVIYMYQSVGVFLSAAVVATMLLIYLGGVESKLKNNDAVTKSTIFSHLTATLEGMINKMILFKLLKV
jgi:ABC-type bacteriocin/lantibiotic exporter with double-glycine peptidase domain